MGFVTRITRPPATLAKISCTASVTDSVATDKSATSEVMGMPSCCATISTVTIHSATRKIRRISFLTRSSSFVRSSTRRQSRVRN